MTETNPTSQTNTDAGTAVAGSDAPVVVQTVQFPAASAKQFETNPLQLARFHDVSVNVAVELGRTSMRLNDLMRLGCGSVVELSRLIDQPVDILAQGVRLGRGEIVTVDDRYAVRITSLEQAETSAAAKVKE